MKNTLACALLSWFSLALGPDLPQRLPPGGYKPKPEPMSKLSKEQVKRLRNQAMVRARVWQDPGIPVEKADLTRNPPGADSWDTTAGIACKFQPLKPSGSSPKFECVLPDGEVLKIKYGKNNPEVRTEVAATRLLRALGFGGDRMYVVSKVRCFGCPDEPFVVMSCIHNPSEEARKKCLPLHGEQQKGGEWEVRFNYEKFTDFDVVSIERRMEGERLGSGWAWTELDKIDSAQGGASKAEVDALRLMAVLLDDWDTKEDNQRLICLSGGYSEQSGGSCSKPFAYIQDVGGTFGRPKLDLQEWRKAPVWKDPKTCLAIVESPPLHGATFGEVKISEGGRRFLAERLSRLSESQVRDLFTAARMADYPHESAAARDVNNWVQTFQEKARQIVDREPCPTP